jgi:hypothetical protein
MIKKFNIAYSLKNLLFHRKYHIYNVIVIGGGHAGCEAAYGIYLFY